MDCSICNNPTQQIFQKYGYWIVECVNCHHRSVETGLCLLNILTKSYQDDYFKGGGAGYPDYLGEEKILTKHGRRYGALLKQYTSARHYP